jgi:hypothetical protein
LTILSEITTPECWVKVYQHDKYKQGMQGRVTQSFLATLNSFTARIPTLLAGQYVIAARKAFLFAVYIISCLISPINNINNTQHC